MTQSNDIRNEKALARIEELKKLKTLPELLTHHLAKRPDAPLYKYFDSETKDWVTLDVKTVVHKVNDWRRGFAAMRLAHGDRVAMLLPNGITAILFDQAALSCALVPVPLHAIDTPGSSAFILRDSGAKALFISKLEKWNAIRESSTLRQLQQVVIVDEKIESRQDGNICVMDLATWLDNGTGMELPKGPKSEDLASLVYTSGTTGNPKGVMLTHRAILANIVGVLGTIWPYADDIWLSFLPLSHTFERTTSYYTALGMGNLVAFNRSLGHLQEDLQIIRPTLMMSVPRVYEKIYAKVRDKLAKASPVKRFLVHWTVEVGYRKFCRENGLPVSWSLFQVFDPLVHPLLDAVVGQAFRNIFGGRPHILIAGGAAILPKISKFFLGLGIPIAQGYGLTETSPIVSVNPFGHNNPQTVGVPLKNLKVRIGDNDEIQVKGPTVMEGYWHRPDATEAVFTEDGWFKTGDQGEIDKEGNLRIKGRIKEIIVTSTGEKIPPADMEQAIETDPLFSQTMLVGDNKPYTTLLAVVNMSEFAKLAQKLGLPEGTPETMRNHNIRAIALKRIKEATATFPHYAIPRNVRLLSEEWTIDNGTLTPTLKLKRRIIRERYAKEIEELYGEK